MPDTPRAQDQGDGHDIVDESDIGAPACGEEAAEAEVDAREDAVDDVAADVLCSQQDYRRIGGEQADDGARRQFHHNRYDDAVDDGDRGGVSQCLVARSILPAPMFCAETADTVASMDDGTRNNALITFSTTPTAAASFRPR